MDKDSLLREIGQIAAHWEYGLDLHESIHFKNVISPKIISLSKKRRLPEGFVMSLFIDCLRGEGFNEMKKYYYDNKRPSYSSRTPAWVKIAISILAKED